MRKLSKILWGIALIAIGGIFGLNAFGVTDIEVFFDGWWTLFIIAPCLVGIFSEREKTSNIEVRAEIIDIKKTGSTP